MPLHCVRRVLGLLPGLMVENTGMGTANAFRYQAGKEAKYSYWKPPRPIALVTTGRLPRHGQAADRRINLPALSLSDGKSDENRTKIGRKPALLLGCAPPSSATGSARWRQPPGGPAASMTQTVQRLAVATGAAASCSADVQGLARLGAGAGARHQSAGRCRHLPFYGP